ncbi:hypothetical protein HYG86_01390 [Alkalicella caledoniensis]|uniref:Uncharacterized protein n=1 Tax=Alkalicella caledoniensis TaxID=2731377 RepID=A0A7G9W4A2_ALKCA|nr:hypothetical protein [Alkalicella caledoniensis]QNO13514.1 hypothetical protein HYG86_01390 [Alkalicella caledoniensis]
MGKFENEVIERIERILGTKAYKKKTFEWLTNNHTSTSSSYDKEVLNKIFTSFNGCKMSLDEKRVVKLRVDSFFEELGIVVEIDEIQHFTNARLRSLEIIENYNLDLGYDLEQYKIWCKENSSKAFNKGQAGYRRQTKEFPFENGRLYQRAYFDSLRDILIIRNLGKPVIRISEMELAFCKELEVYIMEKLKSYNIKIHGGG